jgi:hypothetical protein
LDLSRITTKDVIAVMVVGSTLIFNGISLVSGKPLDAATMTLAGAVVGHYFKSESVIDQPRSEPLARPFVADGRE